MTLLGEQSPILLPDFGDKIHEKLVEDDAVRSSAWERSGLISAGKLGQPSLWAILDILGIHKDFNTFLLGKFRRGNDVEARAINFLTDIPINKVLDIIEGNVENPGWMAVGPRAIIKGEVHLQYPAEYRGGKGYIDIAQRRDGNIILHEVKSATKLAYDRVAASGRSASKATYEQIDGKKTRTGSVQNEPSPYEHHAIQLSWYGLGHKIEQCFLHYFNADDYRLCSFAILPSEYKEEIDAEIDAIQKAFETGVLPIFEPFLDFHKAYKNDTYPDFNNLTSEELIDKLQREYPEQYEYFITHTLPDTIKKETK